MTALLVSISAGSGSRRVSCPSRHLYPRIARAKAVTAGERRRPAIDTNERLIKPFRLVPASAASDSPLEGEGFEPSVPPEGGGLEKGRSISVYRFKPVSGAIGSSCQSPSSDGPLAGTTRIWAARSVRYLAVDENF
jgi:hypothetical protein